MGSQVVSCCLLFIPIVAALAFVNLCLNLLAASPEKKTDGKTQALVVGRRLGPLLLFH